ncbi:hypothetical protein MA16_Dca022379 [Dendrobium catenatum]|uniref:Retrovirus-related Pol polyprotein from transposon TNT 1-94 n=1 Tax=Dendrobium catenatum TaxID=906689 RepID=A0A2I0VT92_9ASPA|nr:hypothetical protein MA16_Dca022379 [Dendrobium catenatum]
MQQIKTIVDNIVASGSKVNPKDIILHILNSLPSPYNPFKAAILTSPLPLDLDNLYSLLCSEEINVNQELAKDSLSGSSAATLYTTTYNQQRGRSQKRIPKNKYPPNLHNPPMPVSVQPSSPSSSRSTCQICGKADHIAINCWHRCNFKYAPTITRSPRALLAQSNSNNSQDWILDSGASTHLTPDINNLQYPNSYHSPDSVSIANDRRYLYKTPVKVFFPYLVSFIYANFFTYHL